MERSTYDRMNSLEAEHWWFVGRRSIIKAAIKRLVTLPKDPSLLEAGCGTGGNIDMLKSVGTLRAFEFDAGARAVAEDKTGLVVPFGALPDDIPHANETFDLICLFDVLEHVEKDTESLAALATRLKPQGRILLTVPAYPWLWSHHDETHHHFRRYTKTSLTEAAKAAGLKVETTFSFNVFLFPLILLVRFLKRLTGSTAEDDKMPSPVVNTILKGTFSAERHLVGRVPMPVGVSLGAVLKLETE